ncbi:hypothetical protein HBA55_26665 [Pseudomaricurvus alkylphenolicus]|jgi:hypothetical protein|uniref:PA3496 family putative envelope integrity protein n=1 Tax=Pseudomaricurvus alkylphenolicus TaxID=1306991 RepID=UPI00141F454E|nr:hypothetical protein [Pseudomaricurvus alkylphenolicus]NIB43219.1 hypothetical protein [Pseudomaricurvus alkylphenolicus]
MSSEVLAVSSKSTSKTKAAPQIRSAPPAKTETKLQTVDARRRLEERLEDLKLKREMEEFDFQF